MEKYDVVLIEKAGDDGITKLEISTMIDMLKGNEFYPIEYTFSDQPVYEVYAMGFIEKSAAASIGYEYGETSPLSYFIGNEIVKTDGHEWDLDFNGLTIHFIN